MAWRTEVVAIGGGPATAGVAYQLPGGERTRIAALAFLLTTAAGGAARQVVAQLEDSTGAAVFAVAAPASQAAALTVVYSFSERVAPFGSGALGFMGGPFLAAWTADLLTLRVQVVSAAAGDVLGNVRAMVAQYDVTPDI